MKKLPLDYIKTFGSTVGDTHFSKVTAMFNFDGSDGDTTTTGLDASNKNLSITYDSGSDQLSSTQAKFGSTSLYVADNVRLSSSDGFNFGTGDFTMEAWFYFTALNTAFTMFDQWNSGTSLARSQLFHAASGSGQLKFYYATAGQATQTLLFSSGTVSTGSWTHLALVRSSGTVKLYVNGTADSSTASITGAVHRTDDMWFGDQQTGGGGAPQYYMDDLRITKGLARYTSNFTAPTSAHLTAGGDSFKQIIVNEDADGVIVGTGGINPVRIARAWVNFNGTGTVAIRGGYNVSSITDNGTGIYTVNFSSNMTDTNYAVSGSIGASSASAGWLTNGNNQDSHTVNNTTSSCRVSCAYQSLSGHFDASVLSVNIFGN